MTTNIHCGHVVHEDIKLHPEHFSACRFIGYQVIEDGSGPVDVLELRDCPVCGSTLARTIGVESRLSSARSARGGIGDQSMIGRCKRALSGDSAYVREYLTAVQDEQMMGGVM